MHSRLTCVATRFDSDVSSRPRPITDSSSLNKYAASNFILQPTGDAVAILAYDPYALDTVKTIFNCATPTPTPIVECANDVIREHGIYW